MMKNNKKSINAKNQWADPEKRNRIMDGIRKASLNPDLAETRRKAAIKRWKNPEFRAKVIAAQSGPRNANWNPDRSQIVNRKGRGFQKSQIKRLLAKNCKWCGSEENLQLDHIIPVSAGGESEDSNSQTLCVKCNNKKRVIIDRELQEKWRENGGRPEWENTVPSWMRKRLEGVETRGRVVRRIGTPFLKIELNCSSCGKVILKQPNQVKRAKMGIYCSHNCRMAGLNRIVHDGNAPTSAPPEREDIVRTA